LKSLSRFFSILVVSLGSFISFDIDFDFDFRFSFLDFDFESFLFLTYEVYLSLSKLTLVSFFFSISASSTFRSDIHLGSFLKCKIALVFFGVTFLIDFLLTLIFTGFSSVITFLLCFLLTFVFSYFSSAILTSGLTYFSSVIY